MERLSQSIAQFGGEKKKKAKYNERGKVFSINGAEGLPWPSGG